MTFQRGPLTQEERHPEEALDAGVPGRRPGGASVRCRVVAEHQLPGPDHGPEERVHVGEDEAAALLGLVELTQLRGPCHVRDRVGLGNRGARGARGGWGGEGGTGWAKGGGG